MKITKKALAAGVSAVLLFSGSVAIAAWSVSGSGEGYAQATSAQELTTSVASPNADLYPGLADQPLYLVVDNPNPFPVTITEVQPDGAVTADDPACTTTGVTFVAQTGLSQVVAASASATFTTPGGVSMDNTSDTGCQGATFTVPVTFVAASSAS